MKKLTLILLACMALYGCKPTLSITRIPVEVNSINSSLVEIHSCYPYLVVDYGQPNQTPLVEFVLVKEDGTNFNSIVDAANYLYKQGWTLDHVYSKYSNTKISGSLAGAEFGNITVGTVSGDGTTIYSSYYLFSRVQEPTIGCLEKSDNEDVLKSKIENMKVRHYKLKTFTESHKATSSLPYQAYEKLYAIAITEPNEPIVDEVQEVQTIMIKYLTENISRDFKNAFNVNQSLEEQRVIFQKYK